MRSACHFICKVEDRVRKSGIKALFNDFIWNNLCEKERAVWACSGKV